MSQDTKRQKVPMYLRPPISYYGGKQLLLPYILPIIPEHRKYAESFVGGGAVYWTKQPSELEIINDIDGFIANFYNVFKTDFEALKRLVDTKTYNRKHHDDALIMRQYPHLFSDVQRAWSFYFLCNSSIYCILDNGMNMPSKDIKPLKSYNNKVARLMDLEGYAERLKNTFIESRDALYVITRHDAPDTFHFIDPPYFNSDCGHYKGYTAADFTDLLNILATLKGKFLLTCYPSDILNSYLDRYGWHIDRIEMVLNAGSKGKKKVECLVRNYTV